MSKLHMVDIRGLLAALLLCCAGCGVQFHNLPDQCAAAFNQSQLGWELQDVCNDSPLDCCDCDQWLDSGSCEHVQGSHKTREKRAPGMVVGPPPVPYKPPMPPKFLPVPARSVFTNVNLAAPTIEQGQVEFGHGNELSFPSGD